MIYVSFFAFSVTLLHSQAWSCHDEGLHGTRASISGSLLDTPSKFDQCLKIPLKPWKDWDSMGWKIYSINGKSATRQDVDEILEKGNFGCNRILQCDSGIQGVDKRFFWQVWYRVHLGRFRLSFVWYCWLSITKQPVLSTLSLRYPQVSNPVLLGTAKRSQRHHASRVSPG